MNDKSESPGRPVCEACSRCGSIQIRTRLITLQLIECLCRHCRYTWTVAVDPQLTGD